MNILATSIYTQVCGYILHHHFHLTRHELERRLLFSLFMWFTINISGFSMGPTLADLISSTHIRLQGFLFNFALVNHGAHTDGGESSLPRQGLPSRYPMMLRLNLHFIAAADNNSSLT